MGTYFDGMADIITSTIGADVSVMSSGGQWRVESAIFRDADVPILSESGVQTIAPFPTLTVSRILAATLLPDGRVQPGNGQTYACLAKMDGGNPETGGLVQIQLERI